MIQHAFNSNKLKKVNIWYYSPFISATVFVFKTLYNTLASYLFALPKPKAFISLENRKVGPFI